MSSHSRKLILSLFPGIGLLDAAFEAEGFTVVRGPDAITGGDIRNFCPPARVFDGVIGGPPCQDFSRARRQSTPPTGEGRQLLSEFCRVASAAEPRWFLCENVPGVPDIEVAGFTVQRIDVDNGWYAETRRERILQYGRSAEAAESGGRARTAEAGGMRSPLDIPRGTVSPTAAMTVTGSSDARPFRDLCRMQGLPDTFELPSFNEHGRKQAVGNGVPLPLGRVIARAVLAAAYGETGTGSPEVAAVPGRVCSECQRPLEGDRITCGDRCRKVRSIRRRRNAQPVTELAAECDAAAGSLSRVFAVPQLRSVGITRGPQRHHVTSAPPAVHATPAGTTASDDGSRVPPDAAALPAVEFVADEPPSRELTASNGGKDLAAPPDVAGLHEFLADDQYPGGKGAIWRWIVDHFPQHVGYVEPFLGSGKVARRKVPALWSILIERDPVVAGWWSQHADRFAPGSVFLHGDGLAWLEAWLERLPRDVLVYLDPPYVLPKMSDQPYNCRFSEEHHARLLRVIDRAACFVVLSGYPSELYASRLHRPKWRRSTLQVPTRWGGRATECLWMNFDPAAEQGWPVTMPGANADERWNVSKRAKRWANNVAAMPPAERAAVVAAVLNQCRDSAIAGV